MVRKAENMKKMTRYLLGGLSEQEQAAFEDRYLMDEDFFEQLLDVENELIHKYVMHELSRRERERFEKHFLSIPQNREKVKLAQALKSYVAKAQLQEEPVVARWRQGLEALWRAGEAVLFSRQPIVRWAYAIAFLFMIFVSSRLTLEMSGMRTQITQSEAERLTLLQRGQALQQQAEAQREQSKNLAEQLQSERTQRAELEKKLSGQNPPKRDLFTVALTPGVLKSTRDANKARRVRVAPNEQLLKLQLIIRNEEAYESYRAILETAEGDTIWSQFQLRAQPTKKARAVILLLPTNIFSYDDYLITLYGVLPSGALEYVNGYTINVMKE